MRGNVHVYNDHVNTDVIIPARYLNTSDPIELAAHCMEDIDAAFIHRVKKGDIIVAGRNFGCGSSREHAPLAIHAAGIRCVIAHSFARIFYRNAINIGLPVLECPKAAQEANTGDIFTIDLAGGTIHNESNGNTYITAAFPPFMQKIIEAGGLAAYTAASIREG